MKHQKRTPRQNREENLEFTKEELIIGQKDIIRKIINKKLSLRAKNPSQRELISAIKKTEITICNGKAGTGKSFVSLVTALNLLWGLNNNYVKIYLIKSVTPLKGEEVGYLKGDLDQKLEPFMWSYMMNLEKIIRDDIIKQLIGTEIIRQIPLTFTRGTTFDNSIIIADEFQNVSLDNAKTLLTRIGENSKMICLGDSNQIDLNRKGQSSLDYILETFKDYEDIGTIKMNDEDDNCRNPIISQIELGFEEIEKKLDG